MTVYAAIQNVMRDIGVTGISKARKNQQQGYQFRGIDDVYNELNPIMVKHGLLMLPRVTSSDQVERVSAKGGALFYTRITADFDFVWSGDGSKHTVTTVGEAMDSADKSSNKAMAAAYKYAAMMAFCIPTEGDNDADAHTPEPEAVTKSKARPLYERMQDAARSFDNRAALIGWWNGDAAKADRALLPADWRKTLSDEVRSLADKLTAPTIPAGEMPVSTLAAG